jgi:hypothetical protein
VLGASEGTALGACEGDALGASEAVPVMWKVANRPKRDPGGLNCLGITV